MKGKELNNLLAIIGPFAFRISVINLLETVTNLRLRNTFVPSTSCSNFFNNYLFTHWRRQLGTQERASVTNLEVLLLFKHFLIDYCQILWTLGKVFLLQQYVQLATLMLRPFSLFLKTMTDHLPKRHLYQIVLSIQHVIDCQYKSNTYLLVCKCICSLLAIWVSKYYPCFGKYPIMY